MNKLVVSPSPHIKGNFSVEKIMWTVVIALLPAMLASIWFFGIGAVKVIVVATVSCVLFEYLIQKFLLKGKITIKDGSAVITGLLLAFNLPSSLPIWMIVVGALVAVGIGKMAYGGLGKNPFNPALVGRVFLLISFPVQMTSWPKPLSNRMSFDALTSATPLGFLKEGIGKGDKIIDIMSKMTEMKVDHSYADILFGNMGGSLGEISALAILIGGIYLLVKKVITWHIPVSFIVSAVLFSGIFYLINPDKYADPLFHIMTGGLMLGAFFMATDMVTSPMTKLGMILFGIGGGLLTMLIRIFGAYPEGVSFAILIMNAFVPLINIMLKPKRFGRS